MKAITNCLGLENALSIPDYPAGFTKRVQKQMWVEFKQGKGERAVSRTSTDITGKRWCAPKPSTYGDIYRIFQVEDSDVGQPHGYQNRETWEKKEVGHYHFIEVGNGSSVERLEWFNAAYGPFELDYERVVMRQALAYARAHVLREQWKAEHPEPPYSFHDDEEGRAYKAWDQECSKNYNIFYATELQRIKASDEVPEPQVAPVAPAQDVVPEGAMF
jgi:hypothetical protein